MILVTTNTVPIRPPGPPRRECAPGAQRRHAAAPTPPRSLRGPYREFTYLEATN